MKTSQTFRTKVFKRAHQMRKMTGKAFAVCLSKAWMIYRLGKRMASDEVSFTYEKVDGSLRRAVGTLNGVQHLVKGTGSNRTSSEKVFHYFDLEAVGFRCFKVENLVAIF